MRNVKKVFRPDLIDGAESFYLTDEECKGVSGAFLYVIKFVFI